MTPLSCLLHIREQLDRTDVPDPRTSLDTISQLVDKVLNDSEVRIQRHVTTTPRDYKNPPHHLRCSMITEGGFRCLLGDGHYPGTEHKLVRDATG